MTLDEAVNRLCDSLDKFSAALTAAAQMKTAPAAAPAAEAPAEQARKPPVRAAAPRSTPAPPKTAEKPADQAAAPPAEGEGITYETLRGAVLKLAAAQGTKAAIAAIQSIGGPKIKSATELPREQWQEAYDHIQGLLAPGVA